jgi:hypothetical protein
VELWRHHVQAQRIDNVLELTNQVGGGRGTVWGHWSGPVLLLALYAGFTQVTDCTA